MYKDTIDSLIRSAEKNAILLRDKPAAFYAGAFAGGAYVGLGIALILSIGSPLPASVQKLAMGATFAVALILVVLAGAELFTGYTMYMTLAVLARRMRWCDALPTWLACWGGNLMGAFVVSLLFAAGGANGLLDNHESLLYLVADAKMHASPGSLVAKAILCNWLVCLAMWMSIRVQGDVAKCVVIFWCLLAFIASGYEHSVANMTLLSLAVIGQSGNIGVIGAAFYNLLFVTLGNVVGGSIFVALLYWVAERGWSFAGHEPKGLAREPGEYQGPKAGLAFSGSLVAGDGQVSKDPAVEP